MKCYVDAGNSRIKWRIGPKGAVQALDWAEAEQLGARVRQSAERQNADIRRFAIASVVAPERGALLQSQLAATYPGVPALWLKTRARCCGIRLGYPDPTQFGVDRFCALAAARERYPDQAVLVINAGTAVTLDYMNASGEHAGGIIMPSVRAMEAGLTALAPNLGPFFSAEVVESPSERKKKSPGSVGYLAVDTHSALILGAQWMMAAAVNQMAAALMEDAATPTFRVLIGGGGGGDLLPLLGVPAQYVPDLVLEGVARAARQQR